MIFRVTEQILTLLKKKQIASVNAQQKVKLCSSPLNSPESVILFSKVKEVFLGYFDPMSFFLCNIN